jgi:predicted N-acyltransferase
VLYLKTHSYGEYVFDWSWARAYQAHGLAYYPKAVLAVPFTPVPGTRLLARGAGAPGPAGRRAAPVPRAGPVLAAPAVRREDDLQACRAEGLMLRRAVQFHWHNPLPRFR